MLLQFCLHFKLFILDRNSTYNCELYPDSNYNFGGRTKKSNSYLNFFSLALCDVAGSGTALAGRWCGAWGRAASCPRRTTARTGAASAAKRAPPPPRPPLLKRYGTQNTVPDTPLLGGHLKYLGTGTGTYPRIQLGLGFRSFLIESLSGLFLTTPTHRPTDLCSVR